MSIFASIGKKKPNIGVKIERVKGALEHIALYVSLAVYTAVGAKVGNRHGIWILGAKEGMLVDMLIFVRKVLSQPNSTQFDLNENVDGLTT